MGSAPRRFRCIECALAYTYDPAAASSKPTAPMASHPVGSVVGMLAVARDGWDWVVILFVVLGTLVGFAVLILTWVLVSRGAPHFTVTKAFVSRAPDHPDLEVQVYITVTAPSAWRLKSCGPVVRVWALLPWAGRRVEPLRGNRARVPAVGLWRHGRPARMESAPRVEVKRLRVTVRVRMHRLGRFTLRRTFEVPPPFGSA